MIIGAKDYIDRALVDKYADMKTICEADSGSCIPANEVLEFMNMVGSQQLMMHKIKTKPA